MKKLLLFFMITLLPVLGNAQKLIDGIYYNLNSSDKTASVTNNSNGYYSGRIVIPEKVFYEGVTYSVTSIGDNAFKNCTNLTNVSISNSVISIGDGAFGMTSLRTLIVGTGVQQFDRLAFLGATQPIKTIWLTNTPPQNYSVAQGMVNYVANSQYGSSINRIEYKYLSSMFNVDGVTYVPVSPSERTCDVIDCIYDKSTSFVNIDETVSYQGMNMKVLSVQPYTFYQNNSLQKINLDIEGSLGKHAFDGCANLQTVELGNNISIIDEYAFNECTKLESIIVPNSVKEIHQYAFYGCSSLMSVIIGDGIKTIGKYAFCGCSNMNSAIIGSNTRLILGNAFEGCSSLSSISIPGSVHYIDDYTFSGCNSLKELVISECKENTVTSFFDDMDSNSTTTFLEIYVSTGDELSFNYTLSNYGVLYVNTPSTSSIINTDNKQKSGKFSWTATRGGLLSISFKSVSWSNSSCSIKDIKLIESNILSLGSNMASLFADCPLNSVYIDRRIAYNISPFCNNTSLYSVTITDNETEIMSNEFKGCTNLENVEIGNSVRTIGDWAFSGCSKLNIFTFGNSVESIGKEAFSDCTALTQLISHATTPPTCGDQALDDINKWTCKLFVPKGSLAAYQQAPQWKEFFFINDDVTPPTPVIYKLTYVVDGIEYKTYEIEEGATITPEPAPTKEGYTFSGWSEIPATMPAHDVTVTGTFAINKYKLIYKVDGTDYKSYELEYGAKITPEPAPTKEGYTFSGWSDIPEKMPAHDVTVTGSFTKGAYKLTYMVDGEVYKTISYDYGATITPEPAPVKDGYTFSGWSGIPATMPAHDVTVTGTFIPNTPNENVGYVDLGLPSGLIWATCNLGASAPEEVGGYYAWGETSPKTFFSQGNYTYKSNPISLNDISGTEYDAATFALGGTWRMPTREELMELTNNCTREETTLNGKACMKFTGPNGNYFYLPKGGFGDEGSGVDLNGYGLWSSTKYGSSTAYRAWEWTSISFSYTWQGIPIRPVTSKKPTDSSNEIAINEESFPDENFRAFLISQSYGKDEIITEEEIKNVDRIDVSKKTITTLKGIEHFTELTDLDCSGNNLTNLDVSKNTALKTLKCYNNQLTILDVSGCTTLTRFECHDNQLTSLDVSGCTALTRLFCNNNQLTSLDLSGCAALTNLSYYNNPLTSLDVSGCTALTNLSYYNNHLTSLDVSGCTALTKLVCYDNQLTSLNVSGCTNLTRLECGGNQLTSLDVSTNTALTYLTCYSNRLTSLDLSECKALTILDCGGNQLTSLDVSNNTALMYLTCSSNRLTTLDVSNNTALKELSCYQNQLTSLDVSKNTALTHLTCFSNQLTSLDVSRNKALTYLSCSTNQLTSLDVSGRTTLTSLECLDNQLTSLDVSGCTALWQLACFYNQLMSLDVSECTALVDLECNYNQLTSLDVSKNTALMLLICSDNKLTVLDVSKNTALTDLWCYNNKIKGENMDVLVESLPIQSSAEMRVIDLSNSSEENVCTSIQVNTAKGKGWRVLTSYGNDYEGSDPSGIQGITLENNVNTSIYDLNGRRLKEPSKGINIIGGKKVLNH